MKGIELLNKITEATALPDQLIQKELFDIIEKKKMSAENIELEDLRQILAQYLQQTILEARDAYSTES